MPATTRALTRAARARAARTGETYTQAREAVLVIRERMDEADETFEEAEAWYDDPRNQPLCETCGWTVGMVCPECAKGCGCETRCTGWRHQEYRELFGLDDDEDEDACPECGAVGLDREYNCVCPE